MIGKRKTIGNVTAQFDFRYGIAKKVKVKASHTRYQALGPELIPVYMQSACR